MMRKIYAGAAKPAAGGGGDTPESAKGSFNASTQQLTLKYDYLVEKINSSTVATAEQKSTMIALLNNQNPVIDMSTDTTVPNSYIYGFTSTDEMLPVGLQVDKATPSSLKLIFTGESVASIGSYEALANYITEAGGQPTTPEMVEAMYGLFVVDENLCTVSGTIGNFSVKFIEDGPVVEKFGATISNFLGDVDSDGVLQAPSGEWSLDFKRVKTLSSDAIPDNFLYRNNGIKTVSFPDLETIYCKSNSAMMSYFAQYSSLERFNCPKLKSFQRGQGVSGCSVFYTAFGYCTNFKGVNSDNGILFPEIEDMTNVTMDLYCSSPYITFISFPKLKKISGWDYGELSMYFTGSSSNNKITSINFSLLEELSGRDNRDYGNCTLRLPSLSSLETAVFPSLTKVTEHRAIDFSYCTALTSVSFPALKSNSFGASVTKPFHNMLQGVTGCTVHFPSNMQSVMENMGSVIDGFGGTNTTVLFDLPATE